MFRRFLLNILMIATLPLAGAASQTSIDSLRMRLSLSDTPTDSISLLYRIFDLSEDADRIAVSEELYDVASRLGDDNTTLDILRQAANVGSLTPGNRDLYLKRTRLLDDSEDRRNTELFISICGLAAVLDTMSQSDYNHQMRIYLSRYKDSKEYTPDQRLEYLFKICTYLGRTTHGELLLKYMRELQDLVDNLPARDVDIRSLFYVRAARRYLENGMDELTIKANRTLLDIIDELEKRHHIQGRYDRNYDLARYQCLIRLLACYDLLEDGEADKYFELFDKIAAQLPVIQNDKVTYQRAKAYYLMSQKRYVEAIPTLKEQSVNPALSLNKRLRMSKALVEASRALGDTDTLCSALNLTNNLLKETVKNRAKEISDELKIIYDVNNLQQANSKLALAQNRLLIDGHNKRLKYSLIGLVILLALLVGVYIMYRKSKKLSRRMAESNRRLTFERDKLKLARTQLEEARDKAREADRNKSDFINNMSREIRTPIAAINEYSNLIADCAPEDKVSYAKRFARIIRLNSDLLLTLVSEVLNLPAIVNDRESIQFSHTDIGSICDEAVEKIKHELKPAVELTVDNDSLRDFSVYTDRRMVVRVLNNLLSNAAKFTNQGHINLSCRLTDNNSRIEFTVTDTGIGIPPEKAKDIFTWFNKADANSDETCLSLYISRLLANILKGSLRLDNGYSDGTRFVFSIPVNDRKK